MPWTSFRTTLSDVSDDGLVELWLEFDDDTLSWVAHFQIVTSFDDLMAHPPSDEGCCLWACWTSVTVLARSGSDLIAVAEVDGDFLESAAACLVLRSEDRFVSRLPDGAAIVWAEACDELERA